MFDEGCPAGVKGLLVRPSHAAARLGHSSARGELEAGHLVRVKVRVRVRARARARVRAGAIRIGL